MAWISGAIAIGGALLSSSSSKKAASTAAGGSERDIAFQRESRDLARGDVAPYREAGYTALDALMSMTGLSGAGGSRTAGGGRRALRGGDYLKGLGGPGGGRRLRSRNYGGHMYGRAYGGDLYNVNELGPESVYSGGSYTRSSLPQTLPPDPNGYVASNIVGRQHGGNLAAISAAKPMIEGQIGYSSPPRAAPPSTIDNNTGQVIGSENSLLNRAPPENPGGVAGGYNFMTDPGYAFRIGEGQRALERGASAAGGLLSGGFGRRLTRYAQDYASNEYTNVYNRISNIAGLGQVASGQSGNAALIAGGRMGNAAADAGFARASGYQAAGNAWANAGNQIAQLPWGDIFNRNKNQDVIDGGGFR